MSAFHGIRYRLGVLRRALLDRESLRRELDEEHAFHLDLEAMHQRHAGATPDDARRTARRRFGDADRVRAHRVDDTGVSAIDAVRQDLRFAAHTLRRSPGFAAVVVVTLALGVASLAAVFSVVDAVLLKPLPLPAAERLALVWSRSDASADGWLSYAEFVDVRGQGGAFEDVAAMRDVRFTISGEGQPEEVSALGVSASLFGTLGVRAAMGRTFGTADDQPGADRVAVLSDGYWRRRFGGAPHAIGQSIRLNGEPHVVVGVLPRGFRLLPPSAVFPGQVDVWVPLASTLGEGVREGRDIRLLHVVGRLRPGTTAERAQADLDALASRLRGQYPATYQQAGWGLRTVGFQEHLVHGVRPALLVLLVAAALTLLVVCSNLASLTVARNATRAREIATRLALGASRARIARQLAVESTFQAALGTGCGLLLTYGGIRLLHALGPASLPRLDEIAVDLRLLGFVVAVAFLATILFGVLPALQSAGTPPADVLRDSGRGTAGSRSGARLRHGLVAGQLALAVALVVAMALVGKSFLHLQRTPLGFDPTDVVTARLSMSPARFATGADRTRLLDELTQALASTPGITAVGAVTQLPLSGAYLSSSFDVERGAAVGAETFSADLRGVAGAYFGAMRMPVVRGRSFTPADVRGAPPVAVVDETLAHRFWPGADPIGRRIRWSRSGEWLEIVGVVRAVKHAGVAEPPRETVYRPYAQYATMAGAYLTVRSTLPPGAATAALDREVARLAPDHATADVRLMAERVHDSTAQVRFYAVVLSLFAIVALVLACVGVSGVVAYDVSRREREVGIRCALGARPAQILWLFGRRALRLIGVGIVVGWALALGGSRALRSVLFGVEVMDPVVFTLVPLLLLTIAVAATLVPAGRAARLHPGRALSSE